MKKKIILFLAIALLLSLLAGCGAKETEVAVEEKTKEEIFTKTIHDFEGFQVENLDDQEDTNFLVYAEKVKLITVDTDTNTLVHTDYENLTYTFTNADETLLALKKGDVVYAKATEACPEGVAAKVKRIKVQDDQVVVYSDEIGLGDLFVYADVCMEVPVEADELELTHANPDADITADTLSATPADGTVRLTKLAKKTIVTNVTRSHALNVKKGAWSVTGNMSFTMRTATLEFYFSRAYLHLFCGVWFETQDVLDLTVSVSSDFLDYSKELPAIPVRIIGFPIPVIPTVKVNISGSISGNLSRSETLRRGFLATVAPGSVKIDPVHHTIDRKSIDGELGQIEGTLSAGIELCPTLSIGFIGNIYSSVYGGLEAKASTLLWEEEEEEYPASRHECALCFDGDVNVTGSISCGLEIALLTETAEELSEELKAILNEHRDGIKQIQPEITLLQGSKKIADFYLSFPDFPEGDSRFGWGECPNIGYRTIVTVQSEAGEPAAEVLVEATHSNGHVKQETTDEDGVAVLYLSRGANDLWVNAGSRVGEAKVQMEESPKDVTIQLRERTLHIEFRLAYSDWSKIDANNVVQGGIFPPNTQFPGLYSLISKRFPNAVIYDAEANPFREGKKGDIYIHLPVDCAYLPYYYDVETFEPLQYAKTPFDFFYVHLEELGRNGNIYYLTGTTNMGMIDVDENGYAILCGSDGGAAKLKWREYICQPDGAERTINLGETVLGNISVQQYCKSETMVHNWLLNVLTLSFTYIDSYMEGQGQEVTQ